MEPVQICGGSLVEIQPLITADSKFLICGNSNKISIFSCINGERCRVFKGHDAKVVSMSQISEKSNMIMSGSSDGKIIIWSVMDGTIEQSVNLKRSLHYFHINSNNDDSDQTKTCFGVVGKNDSERFEVVQFDIPKNLDEKEILVETLVEIDCLQNLLSFGAQNTIFTWATNKHLRVLKCKTKEIFNHKAYQKITCLACHPCEKIVATGMQDGKIVIWRDICGLHAVFSEYHWHSLSLKTLHFSMDGASLYSGGYECVLALWNLIDMKRSLLPRLGSPICRITSSVDGSLVAVCNVHNGIQIVDSSFKIVQVIQGFSQVCKEVPVTGTRNIHYDQKTGLITFVGLPGHLQFYDPFKDCHVFNLDITNQNYTSPENLSNPLPCTEVTHVSISEDGMWMVTGESCSYLGNVRIETKIKFWKRSVGSFDLHTQVDMEDIKITSIAARNFRKAGFFPTFAATMTDGSFRTWELKYANNSEKGQDVWENGFSSYYRSPRLCSFSCDGSILGVVHDKCVTMWNVMEGRRERVMSLFGLTDTHKMIIFGQKFDSNVFYASSNLSLLCWSIKKNERWSVPLDINMMLCQGNSEELIVFTSDSKIKMFVPQSSSPIGVINLSFSSPVVSACLKNDDLLFLNENHELFALVNDKNEMTCDEATGKEPMDVDVLIHLTANSFDVRTKNSKISFVVDKEKEALMLSNVWGTKFLEMISPKWNVPREITVRIPDTNED